MKTDHPILFKGPLVRAIIAGRKDITRRIIKPQPIPFVMKEGQTPRIDRRCPYGRAGHSLWVRETWRHFDTGDNPQCMQYRADGEVDGATWRPSIFMPKYGARLWLDVLSVRAERLQDITASDIIREGIFYARGERWWDMSPELVRHRWAIGWDSINRKRGSWYSNPWVWRVRFRYDRAPALNSLRQSIRDWESWNRRKRAKGEIYV